MSRLIDEDDAALVARCLAGEAPAWEALVHRYKRLVYVVARRARLDEATAGDVFQTVFVRLLEHLPRLREPGRLQAWIVTTAKRETLMILRRGRRTVSLSSDDDDAGAGARQTDIADDALIPEQALMELQQVNAVRNALDRLDARCRELLLLLFRDDDEELPYDEVSRRTGMAVGSIGPTRSRCIGKLRGLMK